MDAGDRVIFADGVYSVTGTLTIKGNYEAAVGARPVIVDGDGYPPAVSRLSGYTVTGLWFGGLRPANDTGYRTVVNGAGGGFTDCTFFNYINGIQNGDDAHGNIYRRNRLVGCGYGALLHPIYIANVNSSGESDGVLTEENIVVGSLGGYGIQLYHEPDYAVAQYNFIGDSVNGLAIEGDAGGPVSGNRNIIWGASGTPLYNVTELGTCDYNVWQGCDQPNTPDDGNYFVDPVPTSGTNPHVWQESDVQSNLGKSSAQINAAISALETSFAADAATIQADATIEMNFAVLKAVIDAWKAA